MKEIKLYKKYPFFIFYSNGKYVRVCCVPGLAHRSFNWLAMPLLRIVEPTKCSISEFKQFGTITQRESCTAVY